MKLSASIYSNKEKDFAALIKELDAYKIDSFHIDCIDDLRVFEDIKKIRNLSNTPIDLHLITSEPEKFFEPIIKNKIESVTFQYENLKKYLISCAEIKSNLGLAINSDTNINVFEPYKETFSFILFMATTPGKSGGKFNKEIFRKIREFQTLFPDKKIHVDGGINHEVSFILRNMGVYSAVIGSFLLKNTYIGSAMLQLKSDDIESHYLVKDFMLEKDEIPILKAGQFSFYDMLKSIDDYKMGFTIVIQNDGTLEGIISNADMRKCLIRNISNLKNIDVNSAINRNPAYVNENNTVSEMLGCIKNFNFPILYLPVVDNQKKVVGVVKFNNLIKGES